MANSAMNEHPTIGLFIANVTRTWEKMQWNGVVDAAREQNINVICFPGGVLNDFDPVKAQANVLYDLADKERLDGVILAAAGFSLNIDHARLFEICSSYRPLPIVLLEQVLKGIHTVVMDNYQAMGQVVEHLVVEHNYRRIAYARCTPAAREDFAERFRAYKETLAAYGIPFDPNLVSPYFDPESLLATGQSEQPFHDWLQGGPDKWEALVSTNDIGVLTVVKQLQSQDARITKDLAIAGFDDMEEGRVWTPPLTTVQPPFYEMGRKAVEMLLRLIEGQDVPMLTAVKSKLLVRRSCGCLDQTVVHAADKPNLKKTKTESFEPVLTTRRGEILLVMKQSIGQFFGIKSSAENWGQILLDGFYENLYSEANGAFLCSLETVMGESALRGHSLHQWQELISVLRRESLLDLEEGRTRQRAENMFQQARTLIGETALRIQAWRRFQTDCQMQSLCAAEAALVASFDVAELMEILALELPRAGISSCYLALYDETSPPSDYPVSEWSNLYLAYDKNGRVTPGPLERRFLTRRLLPDSIWPHGRQFVFVIEPLFFRQRQLGFVILEVGPRDGQVYEALRQTISSPLEGARLVKEVSDRSKQLQANVDDLRKAYRRLDEARQEIEESNSFIESVIASMNDAFVVVDIQGTIIKANEAFVSLFVDDKVSERAKGIIGEKLDLLLPTKRIIGGRFPKEFVLSAPISNLEISTQPSRKAIPPLSLSAAPVLGSNGSYTGTVLILRDISLQKDAEKKLEYLASHDALTDLPNRTILRERVEQAIARADRYRTCVAVFLLDLDHFKEVNDTLGHQAGDCLLVEVARRLKSCIRENDTVTRMGGDEFVLVFDVPDASTEAVIVAKRILTLFTQPVVVNGQRLHISASIGISLYPNDGDNLETLLRNADLAMYNAKKQKGNIFCLYNPTMEEGPEELIMVENDLVKALALDEFVLYYQPFIATYSEKIVGAEALIRWARPEQGILEPSSFIPVAESTGFIISLGEWVLQKACNDCRTWQKNGGNSLPVSVNVSTQQLSVFNFPDQVLAILQETGLPAENLILEITESSAIQNVENTLRIIERLRRNGVRVFLDDFGSGYSSFNWLKTLRVDGLKIDKLFIQNVVRDPFDAAIVRAIVTMTQSLNIEVVAEGVENIHQLDFLRSLEYDNNIPTCYEVQGFFFCKPLPLDDFIKLLLVQKPV